MSTINKYRYECEIRDLARAAVEENAGVEADALDWLRGEISGHAWARSTAHSLHVLLHTGHRDAYFTAGGELRSRNAENAIADMAISAMLADVETELVAALGLWHEEARTARLEMLYEQHIDHLIDEARGK